MFHMLIIYRGALMVHASALQGDTVIQQSSRLCGSKCFHILIAGILWLNLCSIEHVPKCEFCLFVCSEAKRPSQQFFSHVGTEPTLPGFNQYCR